MKEFIHMSLKLLHGLLLRSCDLSHFPNSCIGFTTYVGRLFEDGTQVFDHGPVNAV